PRVAFLSDAIWGLRYPRRRRTCTRRIERTPKSGGSTLQALNRENAAVDKALWVLGCSRGDVGRGDGNPRARPNPSHSGGFRGCPRADEHSAASATCDLRRCSRLRLRVCDRTLA